MGFFDFLKRKPKEEPVALEEIELTQVNNWIEKRHAVAFKEAENRLEAIKEEISQEKTLLKEKIEILETAELKNQKIPDRAKQAMQGNRETYIQKLSSFLEKVEFPADPDKTEEFHSYFDKELNNFEKTVARNHAIVEQFFGEKAGAIITHMKTIDKKIKDAHNYTNSSDLQKIKLLKSRLDGFNASLKRRESLKKEIDFSTKDIQKSTEKITAQESELAMLQKNKDYLDTLELQSRLEVVEKNLASHNASMQHSFSEISTALKKYENLSQNKTAKAYLDGPLAALRHDVDLEILKIISATITAIKSSEITLKDKKRDKTLHELEKLNKEHFSSFKQKQKELETKAREIKSTLADSKITTQIANLKEEISNSKIKLKDKKLDLHEKQKDFEKIDPEVLKKDLEDKINSVLEDKQVKLI